MATILLAIDNPAIVKLATELVMFAGYQPVLPCGDETPAQTILTRHIDAVLIDIEIAHALAIGCETATREKSAALVYVAYGHSLAELRAFAESRHASWFALPNGPKLLARVLAEGLTLVGRQPIEPAAPPPYEFLAALRMFIEARRLRIAARAVRYETRLLRAERLDERRSSLDRVCAAAMVYLHSLRTDGVSRQRALKLVTAAMRESAEAACLPGSLAGVERDAVRWAEEAYCPA